MHTSRRRLRSWGYFFDIHRLEEDATSVGAAGYSYILRGFPSNFMSAESHVIQSSAVNSLSEIYQLFYNIFSDVPQN